VLCFVALKTLAGARGGAAVPLLLLLLLLLVVDVPLAPANDWVAA
jgi:hypothetical protein